MLTNQAVTDFLNYYIGLEAPEYAVMLKGEWGSGKTWFIKNFLKDKYITDSDKDLYLYQSLYGIGSITELENCIFGQLNPFWTSKIGKIGSRVLGLVAKSAALSQGVSGEVKTDDLIDRLKKLSGRVIIFDDLERSKIPLIELLGYINQFVEHDGYRVILLANEIAIKEDAYTTTKEKLVGRTFDIATDVNAALASFLVGIKTLGIKSTFEKNLSLIIKVHEQSGYKNLRILKHSLHDFERICEGVDTNALSCEPLMTEFLQSFLCLAFEIKKGTIAPTEIEALMSSPMRTVMSSLQSNAKQSPEEKILSDIAKKYDGVINYTVSSISTKIWKEIFDTGFAPLSKLNESFSNSKYFAKTNQENWVRLWHYYDLEDEAFSELLTLVHQEWQEQIYENLGHVLHVAGMLMLHGGLLQSKLTKKQVLAEAKSYIDVLRNKNLLAGQERTSLTNSFERTASFGLGYTSKDETEFAQLCEYLKQTREEILFESYPKLAQELVGKLTDEDPRSFFEALQNKNDIRYVNFERVPILSYIDTSTFFKAFLSAKPEAQRWCIWTIKERYESLDVRTQLKPEFKWLGNFDTLLTKEIRKKRGILSSERFQDFQVDVLKPILKKINAVTSELAALQTP